MLLLCWIIINVEGRIKDKSFVFRAPLSDMSMCVEIQSCQNHDISVSKRLTFNPQNEYFQALVKYDIKWSWMQITEYSVVMDTVYRQLATILPQSKKWFVYTAYI